MHSTEAVGVLAHKGLRQPRTLNLYKSSPFYIVFLVLQHISRDFIHNLQISGNVLTQSTKKYNLTIS